LGGREGQRDPRLWTASEIIVMFNVQFVRYNFRVSRVAMFITVDIQIVFLA
jgi:hypothetical protein